jgi:hypothetical protein
MWRTGQAPMVVSDAWGMRGKHETPQQRQAAAAASPAAVGGEHDDGRRERNGRAQVAAEAGRGQKQSIGLDGRQARSSVDTGLGFDAVGRAPI